MKAICNQQYKSLAGIFDKGDKVKIEVIRYKEDTQIHGDIYAIFSEKKKGQFMIVSKSINSSNSNVVKIFDKVVAPIGSYKSYRIKSKNGEYYSEHSIRSIIGYKALGDIFERV